MASAFHKPELALRRAIELQGIQQEDAALELLHDVLSNRRHNRTWSLGLEQVMMTYLQLCITHNKAREAKDGLHQYRNLSQTQAPGSLEKVIRYLMDQAETKCSEAKAKAEQMAAAEGTASSTVNQADDDLDMMDGGEMSSSLWLTSMSTDPAAQRRDAVVVLPALKFLWETYRAVLDILRSNSKLEHVYHAAAIGALRFCDMYSRRNEFRRLCDMLRLHLGNLQKHGSSTHMVTDESKLNNKIRGWEGWSSEAIELHLQTRFAQLETASTLHLYTEGFRTVEDIYNILQISHARRKNDPTVPPPKAKLMAAYYDKLATLFWVSENQLFHAFATYRFYALSKEYNQKLSAEAAKEQASAVLLAALCIPSSSKSKAGVTGSSTSQFATSSNFDTTDEDSEESAAQLEKRARMATLLGFHTRNPTREALLEEVQTRGILNQVPAYLQKLYRLLEKDTDPLVLISSATPLLEELQKSDSKKLSQYVPQLQSVLLLKLLLNLASAYQTVSIQQWQDLVSGLGMSFEDVEKQVVLFTSDHASLSVKIDHRAGCLRFGDVQLESDALRTQLTVLATQLDRVCIGLTANSPEVKAAAQKRSASQAAVFNKVRATRDAEHAAILARKVFIEKRKETSERLVQEKVREDVMKKEREAALRKIEEDKRILREHQLREVEKLKKIQQEMDNRKKTQLLQALGQNTDNLSDEQLALMDADKLQKEHQEKVQKKKDEAERKTREVAKRLDHLVRAVRIEELPLIKAKYEERIKIEKVEFEQQTQQRLKRAKAQWEADKKNKQKLMECDIFSHMAGFKEKVMEGRKLQHAALCEEAEKQAEIDAERAKMDRARKRKDDKERREAEEAERLQREETERAEAEEKRKKEEARRQKLEEEEARRKAEAIRMAEERQRKDKETASRGRPAPALSQFSDRGGSRGGGGGSGSGMASGGSKYVPPSRRGNPSGGGGGRPSDSASSGAGGSRYAGGGRYDGRRADDRRDGPYGGGDDRRGGGGDDRRGGSSYGGGDRRDDRRGGSYGGGGGDDRQSSTEGSRWRK